MPRLQVLLLVLLLVRLLRVLLLRVGILLTTICRVRRPITLPAWIVRLLGKLTFRIVWRRHESSFQPALD